MFGPVIQHQRYNQICHQLCLRFHHYQQPLHQNHHIYPHPPRLSFKYLRMLPYLSLLHRRPHVHRLSIMFPVLHPRLIKILLSCWFPVPLSRCFSIPHSRWIPAQVQAVPKNGVEIEMRPGYNVSNYFSLITFFLRVSSDLKVMVMLILWIKIVACHWQLLEHSFYSAFSLGQNLRSDLDSEPAIQTDKRVTDTLISTRRGLTVVIKLEAQYLSKKWNAREHEKSVNHEPGASKFQTFRVFFLLHR